jgi:hypothetical protein
MLGAVWAYSNTAIRAEFMHYGIWPAMYLLACARNETTERYKMFFRGRVCQLSCVIPNPYDTDYTMLDGVSTILVLTT